MALPYINPEHPDMPERNLPSLGIPRSSYLTLIWYVKYLPVYTYFIKFISFLFAPDTLCGFIFTSDSPWLVKLALWDALNDFIPYVEYITHSRQNISSSIVMNNECWTALLSATMGVRNSILKNEMNNLHSSQSKYLTNRIKKRGANDCIISFLFIGRLSVVQSPSL